MNEVKCCVILFCTNCVYSPNITMSCKYLGQQKHHNNNSYYFYIANGYAMLVYDLKSKVNFQGINQLSQAVSDDITISSTLTINNCAVSVDKNSKKKDKESYR